MAASFVVSLLLQYGLKFNSDNPSDFAWIVIITVACSTVVWLSATFLTAPASKDILIAFYRRVRPSAALWGPIAREARDVLPRHDGLWNLLDCVAGCVLVDMALFGTGKIVF